MSDRPNPTMREQIVHLGVTLFIVGLIAALGLGLTYTVTRKKIQEQDKLAISKAAVEAMPGLKGPEDLKENAARLKLAKKKVPEVKNVLVSDKGSVFILETKAYGGPMRLAVGVDTEGKIVGIAVISNKETVGLGSRALEPSFFKKFDGKTTRDPLEVKKDIQGIAGATITSKAVTNQVKEALEAWQASK